MMQPKNLISELHSFFIAPRSNNEDIARREYIFNVLLVGFLSLTFLAFVLTLIRYLNQGASSNLSPFFLLPILFILCTLCFLSRKEFDDKLAYIFVGMYFVLGTYSLYKYSYILPQGLLIYALVIVVSGILISRQAAMVMTFLIVVSIIVLSYIQTKGIIHPYTAELNDPPRKNVIIYIVIFIIIFLVSWLSNREIVKSLSRARESEKLLKRERNSLEARVKKRSEELEKEQLAKSLELYRYAEFGRLSSSMVHDIANPITAVSINLEELANRQDSHLTRQMKEGLNYIEQYIESARHQLSGQGQNKTFDSKTEIEKVLALLTTKARESKVSLRQRLTPGAKIKGDISKFHKVIANIVANAIDACASVRHSRQQIVKISTSFNTNRTSLIISISDKGMGISKEELPRIYEPFFTTKSTERGTGIGLTITKDIVEKDFRGVIEAQSTKAKDTVFTITIPLQEKM